MIAIEDYKTIKESILSLYAQQFMPLIYEACRVSEDKSLANNTRLNNLVVQAEKIKRDEFTLMVAGEAKSGKSTFINAYLGVDVLPMDVMQCTSSIVEIRYSPDFFLKATYADGKESVIKDSDAIREFLTKNAAVDDKYREIPVSIINEEIISKKKGVMPTSKEIDFLMEGISKDKPAGMTDDVYRAKVVDYIKDKRATWDKVISKIEIGYPFADEEVRGITIVDSPGVGAEGHVGDITYKYITNADAIIFLKSIQGQDLDSTSFKQFITQKAVTKKKDVLFLALTRIAGEPEANVSRVYQKAIERFKGTIQEEQILTIDSKAQMFYNKIKDFTLEDIDALLKAQKKSGTLDPFIKAAWFDADDDRDAFLEELQSISRFTTVTEALNRFARKAHYAQLRDFMNNIISTSKHVASILNNNIELYTKGLEDPEKLEQEIEQITSDLTSMESKLKCTLEEIAAKYRNEDGIILHKADEVIKRYLEEIKEVDVSPKEGRFRRLEELTFRQIDLFNTFQDELRKEIIQYCDNELLVLTDKGSIKADMIKPEITPEMIEDIKEQEKGNSYTSREVTEGVTFLKAKKQVPEFSQDLYYTNVKNSIIERIEEIKAKLVVSLMKYVDAVCRAYRSELVVNIANQKERLKAVKEDKRSNDEKQTKIQELQGVFDKFAPLNALVETEKEGVENHVA